MALCRSRLSSCNEARGRLQFFIRRFGNEAGVGVDNRMLHREIFGGAELNAHRKRPGHEFIYQLVQAVLPAQLLHAGATAVAPVPTADTQLSTLL